MKQWKQLDVAKLQRQNRRVPLSFKIDSEQKFDLYREAQNENMEISSYIRFIVDERDKIFRYGKLQLHLKTLQEELSSFRFPAAEVLFEKFKGKQLHYFEGGEQKSKLISTLPDIYFIILKSFKISES